MVTTTALTTAANTAAVATSSTKKAVINSDFNTFLKMLTTQIKNQDPTNPMDSADFAVQLATFSGVEQQVRTNDMLGTLSSQFGVMGMSQLAAWVGQEARAPSPVYLGDTAVTLTYASATGADRAVLSVKNDKGDVVAREDVTLGAGPYQWAGKAADGSMLPSGKYVLSLESYKGENQLGDAAPVEAYSRILEARSGVNGTMLVLDGGIEVAATAVTALRVAGSRGAGDAVTAQNTAALDTAGLDTVDQNSGAQPVTQATNSQTSAAPPATSLFAAANAASDQMTQPEPETYKPD